MAATGETAGEPAKKGKGKLLLVVAAAVVLMLGGGGAAAYFMGLLGGGSAGGDSHAVATAEEKPGGEVRRGTASHGPCRPSRSSTSPICS